MDANRSENDLVGVILAAGRGTRMAPFSNKYPKPIMPICNRPQMAYHIDMMKEMGIRDVFVVIGHLGYEIVRAMGDGSQYGVNLTYVEQTQVFGIAHGLFQLEPYIKSPHVLFLGDIFFRTTGLKELIDRFHADGGSYLFVKEESDPAAIRRNFSVFVDEETDNVRRVIEKPRYVQNNLKGCGLYLFELPIFDAVRRTPRTAMRDEYEITEAVQILINDGEPVHVARVVEDDVNLTFPNDILRCNLEELDRRGLDVLIAQTAEISPQATIRRSVIGPRARVHGSVTLENCVVFEGATVEDHGHALRDLIITPENVVDCRASLSANS